MASGLPVIATAVGGNPELVVPGETGELVEAGHAGALTSAIRAYLDDARRLVAQGSAARARAVERFSIASMVERYLSMYERLLGGGLVALPRVV